MVAESKMWKNDILENRPMPVRDTNENRRRKPGLLVPSRPLSLVLRKLGVIFGVELVSAANIVGK